MARTYEEVKARLAELEKAQAPTAAPLPTPSTAPAVRAAASAPAQVTKAPLPKSSAAPPSPKVTRPVAPVTAKAKKVEPVKAPEVAPPPAPVVGLTPDLAKSVDYKTFYESATSPFFDDAVALTAPKLGVADAELKRLAQAQGVDLEAIFRARQKGRTYEEIAAAGRERGVIGFMPTQEREKAFTKLATDVEKAMKGDAGDTVELVRSGADKGFGPAKALAGYTFAGTQAELPEVTKPGEHGYAVASLLVEALQKDPSAVRAYDLYGRSLATGGTQQYIEDRVQDLRKRANIKVSDADAMEKMAALRRRAINEVIAYKTVGQWTPVVTLGDVEVTEGRASPGLLGALSPNIELIGFNNKRQAVFRQESPMGVLFRAIDIPQAAVTGVLSGQTMAQGVQTGANLLEYSLEATKDSAPYVKVPAVAAGFLGSVLFPDMLAVGGVAGKAAKGVTRMIKARKIAPQALELTRVIAEARKAGDYAKAATAERELRNVLPAAASTHDSFDAAVARFMKLAEPDSDIMDTDLAALIATAYPAQAIEGASRSFLHPSARKDVISTKLAGKDVPSTTYDELYDTQRLLDRVAKVRADYIEARRSNRSIAQYAKDYVRGRVRDVFENLPADRQISAAEIDRLADIVADKAPVALADMKQFKKAVNDALKADATFGTDAYKVTRQDVYKTIGGRTEQKLAEIATKTMEEIEAPDIGLFDRALKAIKQNSDARGIAAQLLHDEIASTARLRVEPLNLFDDVAPKVDGEAIRLTPGGLLLLNNLRKAFPEQDFKQAYASVVMIDRMVEGAAKSREVSPFALYQELFPAIKRGTPEDLKRLAGDLKAGKVPTGGAPAAPAAAPTAPTKAARARAEAQLRTLYLRMSDAELDEIEALLRKGGMTEGEAYALDALKREKQRRVREARKAAAAAPAPAAAPMTDEERIAQLQAELEQAVQSGDEFRQGELEMEIENLRRMAQPEEVPAPAAVEEVVEAPAAAPAAEAPAPTTAVPPTPAPIAAAVEAQPEAAKIVEAPKKGRAGKRAKPAQAEVPVAPKPPDVLPSIEPLARTAPSPWAEVPKRFIVAAETRLRKAAEDLDAKIIDQIEYDIRVGDVKRDLATQKADRAARKAAAPLERGASEVRSKLLKAQAAGVIDEAGVDLADWLIRQNPRIADNLNVSILTPASAKKRFKVDVGESVAGFYEPLERVVALIKERGSEETAVHEILHHTEQMLPEALQTAIRDEWAKQIAKALRGAMPEQRPALEKALTGQSSELLKGVGDGTLPRSFYQLVNPSEFWAVNASRIVSGRYATASKGLVAKAKQWLTEFAQKVKSIFGLQSDAPLIRGLDAVLKGDGTFVSEEMLSQGDVFRSIEAEAPMPSGIPSDVLRQVSSTGELKGAVDWQKDGSGVIYLFEGADASTVLHEVAHVVRRNILSNDDMGLIASWVQGLGVNVGHQYGEFTGDADAVEQAEELFAKAFEQYVAEGKAPDPGLVSVFDQLKQAVLEVYKGVKDPVIGVELQPQVRQVFDRLLAQAPEQANSSFKEAIRRGILGGAEKEVRIFDVLAREAKRRGIAKATADDLLERFYAAKAAARQAGKEVKGTDIAIEFPVKILGKEKWTFDDLLEAQQARDVRMNAPVEARAELLLDLSGRGRGKAALIQEDSAVESLWSAIAAREGDTPTTMRAKSVMRHVASAFFGGDIVSGSAGSKEAAEALRNSPPEFRRAMDASAAVVEQGISDTVALVNDAIEANDNKEFLRFLVGDSDIRRRDGRPILSSGHDKMAAFNRMVTRAINRLTDDERAALVIMADTLNIKDASIRGRDLTRLGFKMEDGQTFKVVDAASQKIQDDAVRAIGKLLYPAAAKDADFGTSLATAIRNAIGAPDIARPSHEWKLVETLSYLGGVTARDGKMFSGTSTDVADTLFKDVRAIYQKDEIVRRVAVLVGSFGAADQAKDVLVRMNLGVRKDTQLAFYNFTVGEQVGAKNIEPVQQMINKFGLNVNLVEDAVLDVDYYIPRQARERMAASLSRATFRPSEQITAGDAFDVMFRYMKLRMTRGSFFIRPRYFMMNTVDHFNAMAYTAGFGIGAASVARVIAQDLIVLPGFRELIELTRRIPGAENAPIVGKYLTPYAMEKIRANLQRGGDVVAQKIGTMLSVSKYRVEVNPILEGSEGVFEIGGKVYRHRDIRDIAVEEGVFASFDTRELQRVILREGQFVQTAVGNSSLATAGKTPLARFKNVLADWERSTTDIAEAWGERERLGAMVTLMEFGYDPRSAARLTTQALFNYSQSMTKADRAWYVGILLPFWAFQKNANRQVFDLMFSPWGAYRMMAVKRMRDRSADLLTNILYNTTVDDYGIDVDSMPPNLQDSYYGIITAFEQSFGPNGPSPEQKRAMRYLLAGRAMDVEKSKLMMASAEIQRLRMAGGFADLQKFAPFSIPEPSASGRTSYVRDRSGVAVTFPRTEATRIYYSLLGDNHAYMELFWPESTIEAGMRWHTQVAAAMLLTTAKGVDALTPVDLTPYGIEEVSVQGVAKPVLDPERSPVLGPLLAGEFTSPPPKRIAQAATPEVWAKVHPMLGKMMDDLYGTSFLRVPAVMDPLLADAEGRIVVSPEQMEEIKRLQEQYPDVAVLKDQRYYVPGGVWATAFENSPLGELNSLLLRWEQEPLERADIRGEMLRWARAYAGADVLLTAPSRAVKFEEPKKKTETAGTKTF